MLFSLVLSAPLRLDHYLGLAGARRRGHKVLGDVGNGRN
jgi:hypothetical protein